MKFAEKFDNNHLTLDMLLYYLTFTFGAGAVKLPSAEAVLSSAQCAFAILPWEIKNSNFLHIWKKMQKNCILGAPILIPLRMYQYMMMMTKLPILPCAEKLELVLSTAPKT